MSRNKAKATVAFPTDLISERTGLSRRQWLAWTGAGLASTFVCDWRALLAEEAKRQNRSCILLWMSGGPSQLETFDPKVGHENGGPTKDIETSVPGIRICEQLPELAKMMDHMAIVRSMSTSEGDHSRATYLMRTGQRPIGPIQYPTLGSFLSKQLTPKSLELPAYISVNPQIGINMQAHSPGFLGPRFAPLVVTSQAGDGDDSNGRLRVDNLSLPNGVDIAQADKRLDLLETIGESFVKNRPALSVKSHQSAYERAVRMMRSKEAQAFDLTSEDDAVRDQYGRNAFGEGCLLARRLVERNVPFVEVNLAGTNVNQGLGWDTHQNNFEAIKPLNGVLDPAWATLMKELADRGLLETTTILWMGEFGRTPAINDNTGRDHFPAAWSAVLAGGGIRGGKVIGKTSDDGMEVVDRKVPVIDLLSTLCQALGVEHTDQNMSNVGRPIDLVDAKAKPITEALL